MKKIKLKVIPTILLSSAIASPILLSSCSNIHYDSNIQLVVSNDSSILNDQSFSETAYNGVKRFFKENVYKKNKVKADAVPEAKELSENRGVWRKPGNDDNYRVRTYRYMASMGANIVVATGFNQASAMSKIASTNPIYAENHNALKDTGFLFLDGTVGELDGKKDGKVAEQQPRNIASASFKVDNAGFLIGVSTCVFLNENKNFFKTVEHEGTDGVFKVTGYVGLPFPSTLDFLNGFRLGVAYFDSLLAYIKRSDDTNTRVKKNWHYVGFARQSTGSDIWDASEFVSGDFDAGNNKVATMVNNYLRNGASAILPIAGPQTSIVVKSINDNKRKCITIGVDSVQEEVNDLKTKLPGLKELRKDQKVSDQIVQFSIVKKLDNVSYYILNSVKDHHNKQKAGETGLPGKDEDAFAGFGYINQGNLFNDGAGASPESLKYIIKPKGEAFKSWDETPTDKNDSKWNDWVNEMTSLSRENYASLLQLPNAPFHIWGDELSWEDPYSGWPVNQDLQNPEEKVEWIKKHRDDVYKDKKEFAKSELEKTVKPIWTKRYETMLQGKLIAKYPAKLLPAIYGNGERDKSKYTVLDYGHKYQAQTAVKAIVEDDHLDGNKWFYRFERY